MADLTKTDLQIGLVDPGMAETYDAELASSGAPSKGEAGYFNTSGVLAQSDASVAGTAVLAGIVTKIRGKGATILKKGRIYGYDLSGMDYGDLVYLSDTAGALADAAGTVTEVVGTVVPIAESGNPQKVIYIDANWRGA